MESRQTAQQHAATLLDVVFAFVIAEPIIHLPEHFVAMLRNEQDGIVNFVLPLSSIIFCAFYWLETKGFLEDSSTLFGRGNPHEYFNDRGVAGQHRFDLLGTLYLVIGASSVLKYSDQKNLHLLLIFSAVFWAGDLLGAFYLRWRYARFRSEVLSENKKTGHQARWWAGHIGSGFFIWYGLLNVGFYFGLYVFRRSLGISPATNLFTAWVVLVFVVFRHLVWRSSLYCAARDRWLAAALGETKPS